MDYLFAIIGWLIFISIAVFGFIIPSIKCAKKNLKENTADKILPIQPVEIVALIVMPLLGNIFLYILKEEVELLDWQYINVIWVMTILSISFYFLSRKKKHSIGPLTLAVIPSVLITGIFLAIFQFIHFIPLILIGGFIIGTNFFIFSIFLFPAFSLIQMAILLAIELYSVLQLNKNKVIHDKKKSAFINELANIYFGKYYLIAQIITFPIFITIVQYLFMIFTEKPDSIIQAFIESSDGLFSQGRNNNVSRSPPEYICTIAAHGSSKLVKPLHWGNRHGNVIIVTRQLKICNAFEEMLAEKMPKTQRHLRKIYDNLQIPIDKWKKVTLISNTLYILIKPMEWTFLVALYLLHKNPETKIGRQYLPINFQQFVNCNKVQTDIKT